ncbi:MAG: YlxR family protein [Clostridia bacterium]|nr:YlxR family protein [Clostridia bacterium]
MKILKNIPQRTCIGCNEKKDKNEFIRIVKDNQNNISIDKTGKANGRGAYICDNIDCLEKAIKNKKIEKSFKMNIDESVYENLRNMISGK